MFQQITYPYTPNRFSSPQYKPTNPTGYTSYTENSDYYNHSYQRSFSPHIPNKVSSNFTNDANNNRSVMYNSHNQVTNNFIPTQPVMQMSRPNQEYSQKSYLPDQQLKIQNPQRLTQNSQYPLNKQANLAVENVQLAPYQVVSTIIFNFIGTTTYRQLLQDKEYDEELIKKLTNLNERLLDDKIFLFLGDIQPENIQYQIWKHPTQISRFMDQLFVEIASMNKYEKRKGDTGGRISQLYNSRLKDIKHWSESDMPALLQFLNLLGKHPYLIKSVVYLTFIEHCMPVYLWNIKVFQQVPIYYNLNILTRLLHSSKQIHQFLTVTSDGIIISSKNPLETKIDRMVPFTNQFLFHSEIQDNDELYYTISSCTHENIKVGFKKDYIGGLNFHIGAKRAFMESGHINANRFQSFSRTRKNCWVKLYNDGQGYFSDLCNELNKARKQVCITDWWMTPYFLLKREPKNGPISIHKTTNRLDGILKKLADRGVKIFIILFRQPLGMISTDSYDCQLYLESLSRNIRMRRHPIAPQLWSHHEKCVIIDQRIGFMGGLDICYGRWDNPAHHVTNVQNLWDGGDYTNQRLRSYVPGTTKDYDNPPIDRKLQARMPWHDIALQHRGDSVIDSMRHFIQYWYFVDAQRVKDPYNHIRNLQRRYDRASSYVDVDLDDQDRSKPPAEKGCGQKISLFGAKTKLFITGTQKRLPQLLIQARQGKKKGEIQLQLCRSASPWSIGARNYQQSIHNAYQALIRESQRHIYIQNQFFMGTQNKIVECMANRIQLAHERGENFKIIVVMPLLPGFEGDISKRQNGPLRVQAYNQYQSINRGENSLYARLKHLKNFNIDDYIFFFGLRGHGKLNDRAITELIYVHSKLMIVDDKRAIIGSANINDRSLCGNRDSELAMIIEEDNGNIRDGQPRKKDIFDLRRRLFDQHFGLNEEETFNINQPQVWSKIINNAKKNTLIYRTLFGCYPDDTITCSDEVLQRVQESDPTLYDELAPQIYAHAVEFPLHFMEDEDLQFRFGDKEGLLGDDAFL